MDTKIYGFVLLEKMQFRFASTNIIGHVAVCELARESFSGTVLFP